MSRYIRYKYQKQQINFLNCDDLNKWIDTCQTRLVGFDSVCSSSCNCKEYGEYEPIVSSDRLSFAWSGDTTEQTYKINNIQYTATTNPYSTTLSDLGVNEFTSAYQMFVVGTSITAITSIPDTSNVTDMGFMFYFCSGLISLDVSNFETSACTNMSSMFSNCRNLTSLDLSNFDTSNVTNMDGMFDGCKSLNSLDLSNFDTSNVTNMGSMFWSCSGLTSLNVSNFDTSKVTNMYGMFDGCKSLNSLDLSNFDTSKVTNMGFMFKGCSGLTSLDVSSWDVNHITSSYASNMFSNCTSLSTLKIKDGTYDWWLARITDAGIQDNVTITEV